MNLFQIINPDNKIKSKDLIDRSITDDNKIWNFIKKVFDEQKMNDIMVFYDPAVEVEIIDGRKK